jgi:hypothetical protein
VHGNVGPVLLTESYRELFTAVATCAAGLTGLLFVAISVGPREGVAGRPAVIQQVRAASALVAFTSALAVSLFGLVPHGNAGYASLVSGVFGILFTAASVRSIVTSPDVSFDQALRQSGLIVLLFAAFGGELACGIGLLSNNTSVFGPGFLSYTLVALLLLGIARAWELVGNRDTGVLASLAVLTGRDHHPVDHADSGGSGDSGSQATEHGTGPTSSPATPPPE